MRVKRFVINLDKRPDRLKEFFDRFGGEAERWSAVDGKAFNYDGDLSDVESIILRRTDFSRSHWPGAYGCWLSHVGLWEDLVNSDFDAYMIFEDDSFFKSGHEKILQGIIDNFSPEDFDLLYLGGRHRENFSPRDDNWVLMHERNSITIYGVKKVVYGVNMDRTTQAYMLTRCAAESLLDMVHSDTMRFPAIDGWLNERRKRIRMFDVFPHVSWSPINYKSDIR